MTVRLNPNGTPVRVDRRVSLRTPGLEGEATVHEPRAPGLRSTELTSLALESALTRQHLSPSITVQIARAREVPAARTPVRSTQHGDAALEVDVQAPAEGWGQMVLYTDEAGVITWNFARDAQGRIDTTRGAGATRTYVLRRVVPPPTGPPEARGLIGAVGSRLIKVLIFPLVEEGIGAVGEHFARRWEEKNRPYGIRSFRPDNYRDDAGSGPAGVDWGGLSTGRALLVLHGTFSQAHTAFGALPRESLEALHARYEGRVFAFNHYTVSDDPRKNAEWFLDQVPPGARLDLDIMCHSRGGLVGRVFAERMAELGATGKEIRVRRILFIATPNAGTILADTQYLGDLLDSYTNLLNFFPDSAVLDALEVIITVAKQLAVGVVNGLDGLQCMVPAGPFLKEWLNTGPKGDAQYFALTANFEPENAGFAIYAKDVLLDKLFRNDNDLVVPTAGVFAANGSSQFPIEERWEFPANAGIHHNNFLSSSVARDKILAWLTEE